MKHPSVGGEPKELQKKPQTPERISDLKWREMFRPGRKARLSKILVLFAAAVLALIYLPGEAAARFLPGGIADTVHNLSATGPGPVKAVSETRVCIFCHTTHGAVAATPLWNHDMPDGAAYDLYESSTMKSETVGQPTGPSRLCLSCHDGSIALGAVGSEIKDIRMSDRGASIDRLPPGRASNLSTDLSDDHPISFRYDNSLYGSARGQLAQPSSIDKSLRLYKGRVECTTCHEAHDSTYGKFLAMDNANSAMCISCHTMDYWVDKPGTPAESIHKTSTETWNGSDRNPWAHTSYLMESGAAGRKQTVQLNGCSNCHKSHTAGGSERLLKSAEEEENCLPCHNGNVGRSDIQSEFNKKYIHPVYDTTGVHDPVDDITDTKRHVECVDCHNHHAAQPGTHVEAVDGNLASPSLLGVWGVDPNYSRPPSSAAGRESLNRPHYYVVDRVEKEYQICLKCHSSYEYGSSPPSDYTDQGKEFNPDNFSSHPVFEPGDNENCDSSTMEAPWNQGLGEHNTMYCSDCHGSDDPDAPAGPHGSDNIYLLKEAGPGDSYDDLCLMCHKESVYVDGSSGSKFEQHAEAEHLYDRRDNPLGCLACHGGNVGEYGGRPGNIHGTNYQWPDSRDNPGMTSDNLLVGGYITGLYIDEGQKTCTADSEASGAGDGSHCHMEPKTWP